VARRALVQRYLLGTLDEAAAAELRARIIADESVFDEVREVEIDLLDDLARGTLDAETRALVESRLLPIDSNQDAWAVAQALAGGRATNAAPRNEPMRGTPAWWRRGGFLAAAATVIAAAGLAFILSRSSSNNVGDPATIAPARPDATTETARSLPSSRAPSSSVPPSTPSAVPPSPSGSSPAAATPSTTAPAATAPPADGTVVALYLPAGVLRGARPSVRIAPATRTVRIELEIASPGTSPASPTSEARVAIALVDASGREVWSSPGVPIAREDGQTIATIDVPAASLPAGALEAVISPASPASPASPVPPARIPFLVLRD
jgi:hypothetical protein